MRAYVHTLESMTEREDKRSRKEEVRFREAINCARDLLDAAGKFVQVCNGLTSLAPERR